MYALQMFSFVPLSPKGDFAVAEESPFSWDAIRKGKKGYTEFTFFG